MINTWIITGDTHGDMSRFSRLSVEDPNATAVIILGDAGCNYYKNKKDDRTKQALLDTNMTFYLVRGNHEDRPENITGMISVYDEEVQGEVFMEEAFPAIKYLKDGGIYVINGHKTLVIGGAYSVDKWYRLGMGYQWFPQEQLTTDEMAMIETNIKGQHFDFVLSHTCPISWEPVDLFLRGIDQSSVDKSMEQWLDSIKDKIDWTVWLFGHYHADRLERPGVEMFYREIEDMDTIWNRWTSGKELDWWLDKSPNFDEGV